MGAWLASLKQPSKRDYRHDCIFCGIASGETEGRTTKVLYSDQHVVAFEDRSPAAERHLLVVPRAHVRSIYELRKGQQDYELAKHMLQVGQTLLRAEAPQSKQKFGFHRPPFNSVYHLHLHCFALPYKPWFRVLKYIPIGSTWCGAYVSMESVLARLAVPAAGGGPPQGIASKDWQRSLPV